MHSVKFTEKEKVLDWLRILEEMKIKLNEFLHESSQICEEEGLPEETEVNMRIREREQRREAKEWEEARKRAMQGWLA